MKRISVLLLAFALVLCACVPKPEVDAVKQKDTNVLIDTVLSEQSEHGEAEPAPIAAQFPERFQCDFTTDAQRVHVTADVPIRVLTEGGFPMLRVQRRGITTEQRRTLAVRVFGTDKLYFWRDREFTKAEVAQAIVTAMESLDNAEERHKHWDGTEEDWERILEQDRSYLSELQERFRTMSDDDEPTPFVPWDGSTFPDEGQSGYGFYLVDRDTSGATFNASYPYNMAYIDVNSDNPYDGFSYITPRGDEVIEVQKGESGAKRIPPEEYDVLQPGAAISARQAANRALALVEGMGDFAVTSIHWTNDAALDGDEAGYIYHWGYSVQLSPVYEGAATVSCSAWSMRGEGEERQNDSYIGFWKHESVSAWIDRDGTLLGFGWNDMLEVTQLLAKDTPLLPFDEILQVFTQQLNRKFGWETHADGEIAVDDVQLGLLRIREKNDMEHGLMVPVWFFTGTFRYSEAQRTEWSDVAEYGSGNPLLIINAIDGSVIDPWVGY